MLSTLMAVSLVMFRHGGEPCRGSQCEEVVRKAVTLAETTRTRILATLVRNGMTTDQVERILGDRYAFFGAPGDPKPVIVQCYGKYSLSVFFAKDKNGVLRVENVDPPGFFARAP